MRLFQSLRLSSSFVHRRAWMGLVAAALIVMTSSAGADDTPAAMSSVALIPPVRTTTTRDAMAGVEVGTIIYNSTTNALNIFDGSSWTAVSTGGASTFGAGTTSAPGLAVSTDTDSGIFQSTANTLSIAAGGVEAVRFNTAASAVNYLNITPSATGSAVQVAPAGSDTNISLALMPKGTGGVGIGTANPQQKLSIYANVDGISGVDVMNDNTGSGAQATVRVGTSSLPHQGVFGYSPAGSFSNGDPFLFTNTGLGLRFYTNFNSGSNVQMIIAANGNVGIGTTAPNNTLDVNGTSRFRNAIYQGGGYAYLGNYNSGPTPTYPTSGNGLAVATNISNGMAEADIWNTALPSIYLNTGIRFLQQTGASAYTDLMFLKNNGNVGIGTTSPAAKLDVTGEVRIGNTSLACSATTAGATRYNSTSKTIEFCDGTGWQTFFSQAGEPNSFSFTDQTGVSQSATITSNAVTLAGFAGSLTATCTGCTAIARNGTWGGTTVNGFVAGDSIAIRQTSSANAGTATTATVTVGSKVSGTWSVTTASSNPAAFSFTDQTGASVLSTVSSNTATLSGFTGTLTATCNNCTGIARNGVWGVSPYAGFASGDTIAIRMTSATALGTAATATVTVGNTTSGTWSVTTTNGCGAGVSIGGACPDGTIYAGTSSDGNVPMYTTPCDLGYTYSGGTCTAGSTTTWRWNDGTYPAAVTTGFTSAITGKANSAGLAALVGSVNEAPYYAAQACENLNTLDHDDWYLPSKNELNVLYGNKTAIGNFLTDGSWYWSSSEVSTTYAWSGRFSDGNQGYGGKGNNYYHVRCVRR